VCMVGVLGKTITLKLPEIIARRIKDLGVDIEAKVIDLIVKELKLNPGEEALVHLELAMRFLKEGRKLISRDNVQACVVKHWRKLNVTVEPIIYSHRCSNILKTLNTSNT